MSKTKRASAVGSLAVMLVTAMLAGCSSGHKSSASDKAGGSSAPTVLRLADSDAIEQPDTPSIQ